MKLYSLLPFTFVIFGYYTQAQTDTTTVQENHPQKSIADTTKAKVLIKDNGIVDFWRKNTIGHEVNTIGEESLLKKDESTFQGLLSGRVAGVTVVPGQTGLGSSTEIYIRGYHTLGGSQQPLYVVNGIPYLNQTINWNPFFDLSFNWDIFFFDAKIDVGSRIADISTFDIESIEVVQNSSALAIYGSKAANGVILITTKKGKTKSKFNISVSTTLTVETPLVLPKFQNSYGHGGDDVFDATQPYIWGPKFNGQQFKQFDTPAYGLVNGQLTLVRLGDTEAVQKAKDLGYQTDVFTSEYKAYPNNVRDFFETAISNANNVAISGSAEKWNYRLSISNHNLNGIVPNSGITKNNVAFNFAVAPLKFLTISSTFGYNTSLSKIANSNTMQTLTLMGREVNIASFREYYQRGDIVAEFKIDDREESENPYKLAYYSYNKITNDTYNGNVLFDFKLLKNWHLNYQLAIDHSKNRITNKDLNRVSYHTTFMDSAESLYKFGNRSHTIYTTITLAPIDAIEISSLAGITRSKQQIDFSSCRNVQSSFNKYPEVDLSIRNRAIFAQLNLKLLDLYFFEIQERNEKEDEEESIDEHSAFCYSTSTGVSFKKFLKPTGIVSNATIRTSYGTIERLNKDKHAYYPEDNTKDKTIELGFEFEMVSKHLLSATLFRTKTENAPIFIRPYYGGSALYNIGETTYHGINISAKSKLLSTSNSSLSLDISFERSICELSKLGDNFANMKVGHLVYKEGEQYPQLEYIVPMQHNGKIVYYKTGFPKEAASSTNPSLMNQSPDFTMNFAPTYRYKKLSVSLLCSWQKGGNIFSNTIYLGTFYGTLKETDNREELVTIDGYTYNSQTDTYTPYTANISKETYFLGHILRDHRKSIIDASFFKIRELSVNYTFDSPNKKYIQDVSVSLIGRNLLLLAKQDHFDPETAFLGEENFAIPTTRSFSLQLTATF